MKKVLSLALALALVLALAVPAFATPITDVTKGATTTLTAAPTAPDIKITVPSTGAVILNPYGLTVDPDDDATTSNSVTDSVIYGGDTLLNGSSCAINVGMTVTGTPATGVTLLATAPDDSADDPFAGDTKNSIFLQFLAVKGEDMPTTASDAGVLSAIVSSKAVVASAGEGENLVKVIKVDKATDADNPGKMSFTVIGKANNHPAATWTKAMTVKVAVAFTFTPAADDTTSP